MLCNYDYRCVPKLFKSEIAQKRTVLVARVNDPQFSQKSIITLSPNKSWIKKAAFQIKVGAFNLTMKISFLRADFHLTLMSAVRFGIWNFALVIGCAMLQSRHNLALWLAAKLGSAIWQYGITEPFGTLSVKWHLLVQLRCVLYIWSSAVQCCSEVLSCN